MLEAKGRRGFGKTAWLRWLKSHVHHSADTAEATYMGVARFAKKFRNVAEFFERPVASSGYPPALAQAVLRRRQAGADDGACREPGAPL